MIEVMRKELEKDGTLCYNIIVTLYVIFCGRSLIFRRWSICKNKDPSNKYPTETGLVTIDGILSITYSVTTWRDQGFWSGISHEVSLFVYYSTVRTCRERIMRNPLIFMRNPSCGIFEMYYNKK